MRRLVQAAQVWKVTPASLMGFPPGSLAALALDLRAAESVLRSAEEPPLPEPGELEPEVEDGVEYGLGMISSRTLEVITGGA